MTRRPKARKSTQVITRTGTLTAGRHACLDRSRQRRPDVRSSSPSAAGSARTEQQGDIVHLLQVNPLKSAPTAQIGSGYSRADDTLSRIIANVADIGAGTSQNFRVPMRSAEMTTGPPLCESIEAAR